MRSRSSASSGDVAWEPLRCFIRDDQRGEYRLKPTAAETGFPQSSANIRAVAHQAPDHAAAMVFDHHDHDALVEPEIPGRHPRAAAGARETRIEAAGVARFREHFRIAPPHVARRVENELRREWKRCKRRPSCERAVVRTVRYTARGVAEQVPRLSGNIGQII